MKKISQSTLEKINRIEPGELIRFGILKHVPAEHKSDEYVCPLCGNGEGSDATGIKAHGSTESHFGYKCHRCGEKFDNLKLIAIHYGLSTRYDFQEAAKKACDLFGIIAEYDEDSNSNFQFQKPTNKKPLPPTNATEIEFIHKDLQTDENALIKFCENHGGLWRGLPADFLLRFGCRYIEQWTAPKSRARKKYATPSPRVIVPVSEKSYLARLTCNLNDFDETTRKYIREKEHAGRKTLFNAKALNSDQIIFCVEGYIDAMSIEFAGFKAVALGGADSYQLLVDEVSGMETKPQIIILLDSDSAGRKHAEKLFDALIRINCPAVTYFLADDESKIDCNEILTSQGLDNLRTVLENILIGSTAELSALEEKLHDDSLFNSDDRDFYFDSNLSDLTNARRIERFCGSNIRWLIDTEQWLTWQGNVWNKHKSKKDSTQHIRPKIIQFHDALVKNAISKKDFAVAKVFEKDAKISSAVSFLKGIESIRIKQEDLDRYNDFLCVKNGVINLREGKLYPADQSLLLTQQCNAAYDPRADLSQIKEFFKQIMPDGMTRAGLLRWLAYCLTGEVSEEKFMIWLGSGGNGKGTVSKIFLRLLDNYGATLSSTAFLVGRSLDADRATTAINPLAFSRFAICEEIPQNSLLDSSLLKNLTGADMIPIRLLFQEVMKLPPTAKINLSGNFSPRFENFSDKGILRRVLVAPFTVTFEGDKADPRLKEKLLADENQRALLKLLVNEARIWYLLHDAGKSGLIISDAMKAATEREISSNNFIKDFFDEFTTKNPNAEIPRRVMLDKIREKCSAAHRFTDRELTKLIENFGVESKVKRLCKVFKGYQLSENNFFDGEPVDENDIPT